MRRRDVLAAIGTSVALAGCAGERDDHARGGDEDGTDATGDEVEPLPLAELGIPSTICEEPLSPGGSVPSVSPRSDHRRRGPTTPTATGR